MDSKTSREVKCGRPSRRLVLAGAAGLVLSLSPAAPAQPVGAEFRVNTYTSGTQDVPVVTLDSAGDFVVAWRGHGPYGAYNGPRVQRYGADGAPLGGEFTAEPDKYYFVNGGVAAASDPDGNFVVAWSNTSEDGNLAGVFAQRFAANGTPLGAHFRVNTYTTGSQYAPRIGMDGSGNFVVVWQTTADEDGNGRGVAAQRYAATGAPLGSAFRVNTYTSGDQDRTKVSMSSSGDFVVVWRSKNQDGVFSIFGQRYDSGGAPLGSEFRVNEHTDAYNGEPAVAAASSGGFVVVWRTNYASSGDDVRARRFSAAGVPLASEFQVNTTTAGYQDWVSIAALGNSGYVVVWGGGGKDKLVLGQRLTSVGTPLGTEFRVNTYTSGHNYFLDVAANGDRKFVVAWTAANEDGDGFGIYAQRFAALANGDVNGDGFVNVADVFYLINFLFAGGPQPIGPADVNGSLAVDVSDVFYLINALFAGGPGPV